MNMDTTVLLAYVDGLLAPSERDEVETQIALSPEVASCVADLQASKLPYQQAFARQKLPPVPERLRQQIAAMAKAHVSPAANDHTLPSDAPVAPSAPIRSPLRLAPGWLGLAFVAGVACCAVGLALMQNPVVGGATLAAANAPVTDAAAWVQAAAGYQQLYARATVEEVAVDTDVASKTAAAIRTEDGLDVRIPDLRGAGLEFKRVQRLRFHDKPLVQIVYLPAHGDPVALCVMKEAKPDHGVVTAHVGSMVVSTWRNADLGYALIGKPDGADLTALARSISANGVGHLFAKT